MLQGTAAPITYVDKDGISVVGHAAKELVHFPGYFAGVGQQLSLIVIALTGDGVPVRHIIDHRFKQLVGTDHQGGIYQGIIIGRPEYRAASPYRWQAAGGPLPAPGQIDHHQALLGLHAHWIHENACSVQHGPVGIDETGAVVLPKGIDFVLHIDAPVAVKFHLPGVLIHFGYRQLAAPTGDPEVLHVAGKITHLIAARYPYRHLELQPFPGAQAVDFQVYRDIMGGALLETECIGQFGGQGGPQQTDQQQQPYTGRQPTRSRRGHGIRLGALS